MVFTSLLVSSTFFTLVRSCPLTCAFFIASRLPLLSRNSFLIKKKVGYGSNIEVARAEKIAFAAIDKSKCASCVKYFSSVSRPPLKDSSKVNSQADPVQGLTLIEGSSRVCWQIKHRLFASSIYLQMYTIILISTFLVSSSMVEELAAASSPVISSLLSISSAE